MFNTISATLILGEPFTKNSFIGTVLVCIGAVLIATFGAIGEPAHTLDQLLELLNRRAFIAWMVVTGLVVALVLAGSRVIKALSSPSSCKTRWIQLRGAVISPSRAKFYRGLAFAFASGVLSAHTLLLAKSAVELLVRTIIDHVNQFNRWQSWLILIGMICLALMQLYYMHRGLKLCSTSVLYPFVFCVYNIIAILDGLIYFRQASQLAGLQAGLIALGTIILLAGVLCLSWRLEDIDSHAGIVLPNTSQTPLGSGMGLVEEFAEPSDVEGTQADERQPLLPTSRQDLPHKRTPSLSMIDSPYRNRSQTFGVETLHNNLSAQIWADLDDSENEAAALGPTSANRPANLPFTRRRTVSLLSRGRGRRSDVGNNAFSVHKSRDSPTTSPQSRRLQHHRHRHYHQPQQPDRRVSAPVFASSGWSKSPKRHFHNDSDIPGNTRNYGTTASDSCNDTALANEQPSLWRKPLKMLQRWAARISRTDHNNNNNEHQPPPV